MNLKPERVSASHATCLNEFDPSVFRCSALTNDSFSLARSLPNKPRAVSHPGDRGARRDCNSRDLFSLSYKAERFASTTKFEKIWRATGTEISFSPPVACDVYMSNFSVLCKRRQTWSNLSRSKWHSGCQRLCGNLEMSFLSSRKSHFLSFSRSHTRPGFVFTFKLTNLFDQCIKPFITNMPK